MSPVPCQQCISWLSYFTSSFMQVARESVLAYNKDTNITAYHDSIFNADYGVSFFQQFTVVLNALDNRGKEFTKKKKIISFIQMVFIHQPKFKHFQLVIFMLRENYAQAYAIANHIIRKPGGLILSKGRPLCVYCSLKRTDRPFFCL